MTRVTLTIESGDTMDTYTESHEGDYGHADRAANVYECVQGVVGRAERAHFLMDEGIVDAQVVPWEVGELESIRAYLASVGIAAHADELNTENGTTECVEVPPSEGVAKLVNLLREAVTLLADSGVALDLRGVDLGQ